MNHQAEKERHLRILSELEEELRIETAGLAEITTKWHKEVSTDEEPDPRLNSDEEPQDNFGDNFGGGFGEYFGGFHDEGGDNDSSDSSSLDSYNSISHTSIQRRIRSVSPSLPPHHEIIIFVLKSRLIIMLDLVPLQQEDAVELTL